MSLSPYELLEDHPEYYPISTVGFRNDLLTVAQAEELLLKSAEYFHESYPVDKIGAAASGNVVTQFGNLALRLDHLRDQANVFTMGFPKEGVPTFYIGDLLSALDRQTVDIVNAHMAVNFGKPFNPLLIGDSRYTAIESVVSFVSATYAEMQDEGRSDV
jgi:hypothetical protein